MADDPIESIQSNLDIVAHNLNEYDLIMDHLINNLIPKLISFYQQDAKTAARILHRMQMKIDELESLIVAYPKRKQHEHNSDLKMDSEKDKFVREKVDQDRTEIINEQTASNKTKLKNLQVHCKSVTNEVTEQLSFSELSLEKTKRCYWSGNKTITTDENKFLKYETDKNSHLLGSSVHIQRQLISNTSVPEKSLKKSETNSVLIESHRSSSSESEEKKVSVNSCNLGDIILAVWDFTYKNYLVYQENSKHLVFLHSDSVDNLMLKNNSDETPKVTHFSAEILQKDYCCAHKEPNKYNAEKGMKFFRVKIRPVKIPNNQYLTISKNVFD